MDKGKEVMLFLRFLKELGWFRKYKYLYYHQALGIKYRERRYYECIRFYNLSKASILDFFKQTNPYFFVYDAFVYARGSIWDYISKAWGEFLKERGVY